MKINSIFERAIRLCGIGEDYYKGNDLLNLKIRALSAINTTLFDLCGTEECHTLSEEADISPEAANAAVYGTAMFLSLAYGDTDKSELFSAVYNSKRTAVKSSVSGISDVLPKPEAGQ